MIFLAGPGGIQILSLYFNLHPPRLALQLRACLWDCDTLFWQSQLQFWILRRELTTFARHKHQ